MDYIPLCLIAKWNADPHWSSPFLALCHELREISGVDQLRALPLADGITASLEEEPAAALRFGSRFQSFGINWLELVSRIFASWNRIGEWLRRLEQLRKVA
jgi:hypothetical protein